MRNTYEKLGNYRQIYDITIFVKNDKIVLFYFKEN